LATKSADGSLRDIAELAAVDATLEQKISQSLSKELPLDRRAAIHRARVDAELDEASDLRDHSRKIVAGYRRNMSSWRGQAAQGQAQ